MKRKEARRGPDRFMFVRDGFYFWAFLLTPLWMLWRRLVLVFFGYLILSVALNVAMHFAGISGGVAFLVQALLSLLIGLEAATLRRWTLRRRGWREVAVVSAENVEAAERRFFDAWERGDLQAYGSSPLPTSVPPLIGRRAPASSDIVGLFPEPGTPR